MKKKESLRNELQEKANKIKELEVKLESKEQAISLMYNLVKNAIFWNKGN